MFIVRSTSKDYVEKFVACLAFFTYKLMFYYSQKYNSNIFLIV